jgi:hypothetical protein
MIKRLSIFSKTRDYDSRKNLKRMEKEQSNGEQFVLRKTVLLAVVCVCEGRETGKVGGKQRHNILLSLFKVAK